MNSSRLPFGRAILVATTLGFAASTLAGCAGNTAPGAALPATSAQAQSRAPFAHSSLVDRDTTYSFTTLDDQSDPTFNQLLGINDKMVISGYFGSGLTGHPNKGYVLNPPYNQNDYTNENFPNSAQTQVTCINDKAYTGGFWVDGNGNNFGFVEWNGVFTSYKDPKTGTGTVNQILGLNDKGLAVGFYTDGNGLNHAYQVQQGTTKYVPIVPPGSTSAVAAAVNKLGDVAGFMSNSGGTMVSFLYKNNAFTEFSYPNAVSTMATGINAKDEIVGVYVDSANAMHGFTLTNPLKKAKYASIDDPLGVGTTTVNGVNDSGVLVGFYVDSVGNTDGMLAVP